jgi:hypothetical protein
MSSDAVRWVHLLSTPDLLSTGVTAAETGVTRSTEIWGGGGCGLQIDGDMILGSTGGVGVVRSVMNRCVRMIRWFGSSVGSIVNTPRCSINILCACMYIYTQRVYTQYILSDY